jgi:hypothetical protein
MTSPTPATQGRWVPHGSRNLTASGFNIWLGDAHAVERICALFNAEYAAHLAAEARAETEKQRADEAEGRHARTERDACQWAERAEAAERNRDMWKGQCGRQSAVIADLRAQLAVAQQHLADADARGMERAAQWHDVSPFQAALMCDHPVHPRQPAEPEQPEAPADWRDVPVTAGMLADVFAEVGDDKLIAVADRLRSHALRATLNTEGRS